MPAGSAFLCQIQSAALKPTRAAMNHKRQPLCEAATVLARLAYHALIKTTR